ncbi:phage tail tape measure protein [Microtetraspora malaysiensis]|uniref:Phage tail tape measure protein n=1 Tax=Microtetraspora malaysiensis TaxID=161358 RepID=A0ABW6T6A4_9ACTN
MPSVGYATLQVIPSVKGIGAQLRDQLVGPAASAGTLAGEQAGRGFAGAFDSLAGGFSRVGQAVTGVGQTVTTHLSLPVAALGGLAIKTAGDFEAGMNRVRAISGATGSEFTQLRDLAKQLGATTQYSASEAADAMGFLAMAGFKTTDIMGALPGVLNLAAAGAIDLGTAADIASNILSGYGIQVSELGRVNDILAKTFTSTNVDMRMLGESFKYVGPVAASAGLQFEEMSAAIGLLGNAGIQGSEAGTALRGAIGRLLKPTNEVQATLDRLGVTVMDSSGKMRPLVDIITQLEKSGASTADMLTIFGLEAGPGMQALVSQGSGALRDLTKELENSGGTAANIAAVQMEGFNGAVKGLQSAFEGLMIAVADTGLLDWATKAVNKLTEWVSTLGEADKETMKWAVAIGGAVAALGPLLIVTGHAVSSIGSIITGVRLLSTVLLASPIGWVVGLIGLLAYGLYEAWQRSEEFRNAVTGLWDGIVAAAGPVVDWFKAEVWPILVDGWNWLLDTAVEVVEWFGQNIWPKLVQGFGRLVEAAKPIVAWFKDEFLPGLVGIWGGLMDAAGPVLSWLGGTALPAVIDALVWLLEKAMDVAGWFTETLWPVVVGGWQWLIDAAGPVVDTVVGFFSSMTEGGGEFSSAFGDIGDFISEVVGLISDIVSEVVEFIGWVWREHGDTIVSVITTAWDLMVSVIGTALELIWNVVQGVWTAVKGIITGVLQVILGVIRVVTGIITGDWDKVWQGIKDIFEGVWKAIRGIVEGALQIIVSVLSAAWDLIGAAVKAVWDWIVEIVKSAVKWLLDMFTSWSLPGLIVKHWDKIKDTAGKALDGVITFFRELPGRILTALGNLGTLLVDSGKKIVQGLIDGLKSMLGAVGDAAASIVEKIKGFLPFSPAKEGPFSGWGNPLYSGRSIARLLAAGLDDGQSLVTAAADRLASSAAVAVSPTVAVVGGATGPHDLALAQAGAGIGGTLEVNFAGRPLVSEDDIFRLLIAALNQAKARGFNLGNLSAVTR